MVFTYIFVRRYHGRLAGTISALLYATAVNVIIFSRDIWQPNLLPLFVVLLLFLLFRGVVQKKPYWFSPAVLLVAAMYQFHSTAVYTAIPLVVAMVLAFKTIRWRELPLTVVGLLLLFAPYIYLEHRRQYIDIVDLFHVANKTPVFSKDALSFYIMWIHSFVLNPLFVPSNLDVDTHLIPSDAHSILLTTPLQLIAQFSQPESTLMSVLLVGAWLMAAVLILWPFRSSKEPGLRGWWKKLLNSPERQGLILLLIWQGTILLLLRHSVTVYVHYLIYLLPGPFILIGILLATIIKWVHGLHFSWVWPVRYGLYALVGVIVLVQTVSSAGWLIDHAHGNFDNGYAFPQYFDLATEQRIINNADQLAQQRHLSRIYINLYGGDDVNAVTYLAQFAHTPIAVSNANQCLLLPDVASGPVVYITDPDRPDIDLLVKRYTTILSVSEIQHPGGAPLTMYVLSAKPEPKPALQLNGGLQLLSQQADATPVGHHTPNLMVTRWKIQNSTTPEPSTNYNYSFLSAANPGLIFRGKIYAFTTSSTPYCRLSRNWSGDELIPLFSFNHMPKYLSIGVEKFITAPQHYDHGSLKLVTSDDVDGPHISLRTKDGKDMIKFSLHGANQT